MGANSSKGAAESSSTPGKEEQAFYAERPVRFSPSLIQHLSDLPAAEGGSNAPSATRQSTLDEHIRTRINSELARLKAQEAEIQEKISRALEKDNLDKEAGGAKDEGGVRSSVALQQELEEIERKVQQHRERKDPNKTFPEVVQARKSLVACYLENKDRPLDCWEQAADFRSAVKRAEQAFVESEAVKVQ